MKSMWEFCRARAAPPVDRSAEVATGLERRALAELVQIWARDGLLGRRSGPGRARALGRVLAAGDHRRPGSAAFGRRPDSSDPDPTYASRPRARGAAAAPRGASPQRRAALRALDPPGARRQLHERRHGDQGRASRGCARRRRDRSRRRAARRGRRRARTPWRSRPAPTRSRASFAEKPTPGVAGPRPGCGPSASGSPNSARRSSTRRPQGATDAVTGLRSATRARGDRRARAADLSAGAGCPRRSRS
jgi:hypothetical protein